MKRKICLIPLTILPLLSACNDAEIKGDFYIGNSENSVIELIESELSAKLNSEFGTFFLATHQGDSCTCWTGFQFVMQEYNNNRTENTNIPFYAIDTDLLVDDNKYGIDKITSGYVEFYVIVEGKIEKKYSKSAKIDFEMFEKSDKFGEVIEKYINSNPILNYEYISYERACTLINDITKEFVLFTVRSGCGDCIHLLPNVLTPWLVQNGSKIPVYLCDIERYKDTKEYDEVRNNLKITEASSPLGYDVGRVPTYQYWKNGQLMDAGVYGNDLFVKDEATGKNVVTKSYFDGTRELKYTDVNLVEQFNAQESLDLNKKPDGSLYMEIKKEADFHDPILKEFLSYYCK
mgnify:CR=1 FL=1